MLTLEEEICDCRQTIHKLIEELNYCDWRLYVTKDWLDTDGVAYIYVGTMVQDSYHPEKVEKIPFGRNIRVAVGMTEEQMCWEIVKMILALTDHEVFELFQRNGTPVFNVHDTINAPHMEFDPRYRMICSREDRYQFGHS